MGTQVSTNLYTLAFGDMVKIFKYLLPKQIAFLNVRTHNEVIDALVALLEEAGKIPNARIFKNAINEREKIVTTGIGMGVAIPHAKLAGYDDFFIAIGILDQGVDWKALDGAPVRLVLLIGGPDDKQTEYLQILSALTLAIKDEERRKKILSTRSPEEVITLLKDF